jgi:hypothetical protein
MSVELAKQLIDRLDRLSADSAWAHQAGGVKGTLLRHLDQMVASDAKSCLGKREPIEQESLDYFIEMGFDILNKAAAEIFDIDHDPSS